MPKIYRNHVSSDGDCSGGFRWFATLGEANADAIENPDDYDWQFGCV